MDRPVWMKAFYQVGYLKAIANKVHKFGSHAHAGRDLMRYIYNSHVHHRGTLTENGGTVSTPFTGMCMLLCTFARSEVICTLIYSINFGFKHSTLPNKQ